MTVMRAKLPLRLLPLFLLFFFLLNLSVPVFAQAQVTPREGLIATAKQPGGFGGAAPVDLATFIGKIIQAILQFVGVVAFILFIIGGFMWMTARGNEEKVKG